MGRIIIVYLKGLIISIIITIISIFVLSGVLAFTNISENVISPSIIGITSISVLIGSFIVSQKLKERGFMIGLILSSIYILCLYLFSSIASGNFALTTASVIMIIVSIVCGIFGGILGVNKLLK